VLADDDDPFGEGIRRIGEFGDTPSCRTRGSPLAVQFGENR